MRKYTTILIGLFLIFIGSGCSKDDDPTPETETDSDVKKTNEWIYSVMDSYYLWYDDIPDKSTLDFTQEPETFFKSLLSSSDGVMFNGNKLVFSTIEKKTTSTKSIIGDDTYGFEFASFKTTNGNYYAWVLYILPDSPADKAGIKRGDWIVGREQGTARITDINEYISGSATTFSIAEFKNNSFYFVKDISITASQVIESSPILKDSIYNINGKKVGYLVYESFISGPDNKDKTYDNELLKKFVKFKSENVTEFVLDLRYNGGGLVTSAQLLTSLLAPSSALGKTFCQMKYNTKHSKDNQSLLFLTNDKLDNSNLNLSRIAILTGQSTASASEAVINCLIPYMQRSNIRIIGEKTIGKTVGSNTFGEDLSYDWLLHPITLRIYNADGTADYNDGFSPDVEVEELVVSNTLLPFGDTSELLLQEAISWITGASTKSINMPIKTQLDSNIQIVPKRNKLKGGLIFDNL